MPKDLTIWIDPGEVSFSVGEKGQVRVLYSERRATTPAPGGIAISLSTLDDNPLSGSQLSAFTSLSSAVTSIPSGQHLKLPRPSGQHRMLPSQLRHKLLLVSY